eukprot:1007237_1
MDRCLSSRLIGLIVAVPVATLYIFQIGVSIFRRVSYGLKESWTAHMCRIVGMLAAICEVVLHVDAHYEVCPYKLLDKYFTRCVRFNTGGLVNAAFVIWVYVAVSSLERARLSNHYNGRALKIIACVFIAMYPLLANLSFGLAVRFEKNGYWTWSFHASFSIISNVLVVARLLVAYFQLRRALGGNSGALSKESKARTLKVLRRYRIFTAVNVVVCIIRTETYTKKFIEILSNPFKRAEVATPLSAFFDIMHVIQLIQLATFLWFFWISPVVEEAKKPKPNASQIGEIECA